VAVALVAALALPGCGSGGPGQCTGDPVDPSCNDSPCGGDIVGRWTLVQMCAPPCVSSIWEEVSYDADGTFRGPGGGAAGTWATSGTNVTRKTPVGSSGSAYCVRGDRLWESWGTNCGATGSGPVTTVRRRDCSTPTSSRPTALTCGDALGEARDLGRARRDRQLVGNPATVGSSRSN